VCHTASSSNSNNPTTTAVSKMATSIIQRNNRPHLQATTGVVHSDGVASSPPTFATVMEALAARWRGPCGIQDAVTTSCTLISQKNY
jgi:hypothetical protein